MNSDFETFRTIMMHEQTRKAARKEKLKAELSNAAIPIPDHLLGEVVELFVTDAIEVLQAHPGFSLHDKIRSVRVTRELFDVAAGDLIRVLDAFHTFSRKPEFNYRSAKADLARHESQVRKEIFAFSTLAHSLQDQCRHVRRHWDIPLTTQKIAECFGSDGMHDFICNLRNALHHISMVEADWMIKNSGDDTTSHYIFERKELLLIDGAWNASGRKYLEGASEKIDVRSLVDAYIVRVKCFYDWFLTECDTAPPPAVSDYRRCWKEHRQNSYRLTWNLLLTEFQKRSIDPYAYLDRYLTAAEYEDAERLPMRSREQVDFIIRAIDELGACNDEIRSRIYRLFGVVNGAS